MVAWSRLAAWVLLVLLVGWHLKVLWDLRVC
jgi:hypothetical protein